MCSLDSKMFEDPENEIKFEELCEKLKNHPFKSIWQYKCDSTCDVDEIEFQVKEIDIPSGGTNDISTNIEHKNSLCESNFKDVKDTEANVELLSTLNDHLKNSPEDETVNQIVYILQHISIQMIPELSQIICSSVNEEALPYVLRAILQLGEPLGLSITTSLVRQLLYPQLFEKKNRHTRNEITYISSFCEAYPKIFVEEVLVPCLNNANLGIAQFETLLKIIRSYLHDEYIPYCLQKSIDSSLPNENTFVILQNLFEKKVTLEQTLVERLTRKIELWSDVNKKSVKFLKMIITILSSYGEQLDEVQLTIYKNIIQKNETIMKKAAESILRKLNAP